MPCCASHSACCQQGQCPPQQESRVHPSPPPPLTTPNIHGLESVRWQPDRVGGHWATLLLFCARGGWAACTRLHSAFTRSAQPPRQLEKHQTRTSAFSGRPQPLHSCELPPNLPFGNSVLLPGVGLATSAARSGLGGAPAAPNVCGRQRGQPASQAGRVCAAAQCVWPDLSWRARTQQEKSAIKVGSRDTKRSMRSVGRRQLNTIPPATTERQLLLVCCTRACIHPAFHPNSRAYMLALTSRSICRMGASAPPSTKVSRASDSLQWRVSWAWCWSPCTQASGGPDAAGASPIPEWGMPSVECVHHTAPRCALQGLSQ